jgi:hypothetical protein
LKSERRIVRGGLAVCISACLATAWLSACSGRTFKSNDGSGGSSGTAGKGGTGAAGTGGGGNTSGGSASGGKAGGAGTGTGGGETCGSNVCGPGQYCCNPSCSTCAPLGAGCPAIACVDAGQPAICGNTSCAAGEVCCGTESCGYCYDGTAPCDPPICTDDGGMGDLRCGRVICGDGLVCCNPSCSTCTDPEGGCAGGVCPPDCTAMDAQGEGSCELVLGVTWTGTECAHLSGCSCAGTDCPNLFRTLDECVQLFDVCI